MRIFNEEQKFDQWWFKLLMIGITIITVGSMIWAYPEVAEDEKTVFFATAIPATTLVILLTALTFFVRLQTKIDGIGIHYGFWPFQRELRTAAWHEIEHCNVTKYSPISDYGGWGYKFSMSGKGKVYSTKGNMGIAIVYKNKRKTLVGTQKADEARQIIATYMNK